MNGVGHDLRYAVRMLAKQPGFTAIAVIALALGIGANTAIFSVVNTVLLKPLPFEQPDRLVMVWEKRMALGRVRNVASAPDFYDWRSANTVFEDMAAYQGRGFTLSGGEVPERIQGVQVSPSLFSVLRAKPEHGRAFLAEEDQPGKNGVAIISHGLWKRRFGGDLSTTAAGGAATLIMDDRSYTIVGVMPAGFVFPDSRTDIWIPLTVPQSEMTNRGSHGLNVVARLSPGVTLDAARADMDSIASKLEQQYQVNTGHGVNIFSLHEEVVGNIRPALLVMFAAVGFVLLIACANVANLLLARATAREREVAMRSALGAGRFRIVRQLLTESLMLSLAGGLLGVLLAMWGLDLLVSINAGSIPRATEVRLDGWVLGFTICISLATGIIFGLAPALQASKPDLNEGLKEGARGSGSGAGRNRARSVFVVTEVAICLVLLIAAGLMIKSFSRLLDVKPGFEPEKALAINVALSGSKYGNPTQITAYFEQALGRISAVPGVEAAGTVTDLPLGGGAASRYFRIEGRPPQPPGQGYNANLNVTSPGYFKAMGIPMIQGRDFEARDVEGAPEVAIINEEMARLFWPDEDPIGQRIAVGDGPWRSVVGIVGNVKYRGLDADTRQEMYWPSYQVGIPFGTFVVRTTTDPKSMIASVRSAIQEVDRDMPLYDTNTLEGVLLESVAPRRVNMLLLAVFAGVALVLAAVGLYGVMSYSVSQRTHEIGIRMALGASSSQVLGLVVGEGMALTGAGLVVGAAAAYGLTRLMAGLLFGVKPTDPLTFVALSGLLAGIALVASYVPGRRAAKVDPIVALRYE